MSYKISDNLVLINSNDKTFAYNSIFGGLHQLTDLEINTINQTKKSPNYEDSLSHSLALKNFLNIEGEDEIHALDEVIEKYRQKILSGKSITKLLLMVTEKCMLRCKYCYVPEAPGNIKHSRMKDMNWSIAKASIEAFKQIIDSNGQKIVHIRFHGGEPLIKYELIKKATEYINELYKNIDVKFHINTNGIPVNDEIANFLSNHNYNVEISIDGVEDIHNLTRSYANGEGSFQKAMQAMELLKKYNPNLNNVNIALTLNKYNYRKLNELVDYAYENNIKEIEINTLLFESNFDLLDDVDERVKCLVNARKYGVSKGIKISGKWFKLFERLSNPVINYCGRMGQQISVDSDGEIFLCTGYMEKFGNIENWHHIFSNPKYIEVCMRVLGNIPECSDCSIQGLCAGGCTASVIKSYQKLNKSEQRECEFRRKMVVELIKNINHITNDDIATDAVDSSYVPTIKANQGEK